jgi:hypothetical protein
MTWLALGGAYSVDQHKRTEGRDWWPEEVLTEDDAGIAMDGGRVDVMLTHDSPDGTDLGAKLPPNPYFPEHLEGAQRHRKLLGRVVDEVCPQVLFHGHYHVEHLTSGKPRTGGESCGFHN